MKQKFDKKEKNLEDIDDLLAKSFVKIRKNLSSERSQLDESSKEMHQLSQLTKISSLDVQIKELLSQQVRTIETVKLNKQIKELLDRQTKTLEVLEAVKPNKKIKELLNQQARIFKTVKPNKKITALFDQQTKILEVVKPNEEITKLIKKITDKHQDLANFLR